jgi:hypothetical protein
MIIIQLNSHLFTCKLNSPETNYKVCTNKQNKKNKTLKQKSSNNNNNKFNA